MLTTDYKRFDPLQQIIPGECIITQEAMLPGLIGETFPAPDKDPKKDNAEDKDTAKWSTKSTALRMQEPSQLYIHNIEVVGSLKIEDFLTQTLAAMQCDKEKTGHGRTRDPGDINVSVKERRLNVTVHNTWRQVAGETRSCTLQRPDDHGIFKTDNERLSISNYLMHQLSALVFELNFVCSV